MVLMIAAPKPAAIVGAIPMAVSRAILQRVYRLTPGCSNLGDTTALPSPVDMDVGGDTDADQAAHDRLSGAHWETESSTEGEPV